MPQTTPGTQRLLAVLTALTVVSALVIIPQQPASANTAGYCGRTILVLDESWSVWEYQDDVRDAVMSFFGPLVDSGVDVSVIEFADSAVRVFDYLPVDATSLSNNFGPYVDPYSSGHQYSVPSQLGNATNWEDALDEAARVNEELGVAPMVLFLTDGEPTAYNTESGVATGYTAALNNAITAAAEVHSQGSHLIAVGVGEALTDPASIERLTQIAGPNVYDGSGVPDLASTDVVLVPDFAGLPEAMALIAEAMCVAEPPAPATGTGTGTPGYWKNHPEAWPIVGDTVLIGDWNHNGVCDGSENCVEMTLEDAMAALGTPPRGDMTWNLARPLVAAWLNVSAGNDPSCVTDSIHLAAAWLSMYEIGSEVAGSDPAWEVASAWAERLDDYNNGLLCADHRDADGTAESESSAPQEESAEPWTNGSGGNPPPSPPGKGKKP